MADNANAGKILFHALLRIPDYPVIIVGADRLRTAKNLKGLAEACLVSPLPEGESMIIAIDITGDEFWHSPGQYAIIPGFVHKQWTKKRMVDLYNQSTNARETGILNQTVRSVVEH